MEKLNIDNDLAVIKPYETVKVTKTLHKTKLLYMERMNRLPSVRKLDKDHILVLRTGEIKEINHAETRADGKKHMYTTMNHIRDLVENNFRGTRNELFLTLTYEENMTDLERLKTDLEKFTKKLRYKFSPKCKKGWGVSSIDYITVVEPQERGAWHAHVLLRFNDLKTVYLNNDEKIKPLWGHGITKTKALKGVESVAGYLQTYLSDIELNNETASDCTAVGEKMTVVEKEVEGESKSFIKGARLKYYPAGMNIYRKSKGIQYPSSDYVQYEDIKKEVGHAEPDFLKAYPISTDDGFTNRIVREEYKLKTVRKK